MQVEDSLKGWETLQTEAKSRRSASMSEPDAERSRRTLDNGTLHMLEHLFLPSGITVASARREAAMVASTKQIPLSDALDEVAREHCANMTWSQAMDWLTEEVAPLATFSIPLRGDEEIQAEITQDANTVLLLGAPGTGKTVTSLILAEQSLKMQDGIKAYLVSGCSAITGDSSADSCLDERYIRNLMLSYPGQVVRCRMGSDGDLPGEGSPRGTIIILDEINSIPGSAVFHERLPRYMETTKERGHVLVVCAQAAAEVIKDAIPDGIRTMLLAPLYANDRFTTLEARTMQRVLGQLQMETGVHTEFLAVVGDRSAIARIPIPKL